MSDAEIKQTMRVITAVNGMTLTDQRIEIALTQYQNYLAAIEALRRVPLPLEAEPTPVVVLDRSPET